MPFSGAIVSGTPKPYTSNQLGIVVQSRSGNAIESGGLLQASFGHCAIDDVDRLTTQQGILMHSLQSQVLTLPFSGVYANIKTHTSILASASSMRGHYDKSKLLTENIRINSSLPKEFQLVFLLVDKPNKNLDTSLTEHIRLMQEGDKKSIAIAARFALKPKTNNSMNTSVSSAFEEENKDEEMNDVAAGDASYDLEKCLRLTPVEELEMDLLPALCLKKFIGKAVVMNTIGFRIFN